MQGCSALSAVDDGALNVSDLLAGFSAHLSAVGIRLNVQELPRQK